MVLNDQFRKDVRIKISPIERSEYTPPSGIDVRWYPYQDEKREYCNATFMGSTALPRIEQCRDLNDINDALSRLKVVQDSITDKDEPLLVKNFGLGIYAMIDTPLYDGERDHYRSESKEEYMIPVKKEDVNDMNNEFERLAPILPTTHKKYEFKESEEVKINDVKHVIMRMTRIM